MTTVTASVFQKKVGEYQDRALTEPVLITSHGRERLALISAAEYRRLRQLDRMVRKAEELPDDMFEAIAAAEVPAGQEHLDKELD